MRIGKPDEVLHEPSVLGRVARWELWRWELWIPFRCRAASFRTPAPETTNPTARWRDLVRDRTTGEWLDWIAGREAQVLPPENSFQRQVACQKMRSVRNSRRTSGLEKGFPAKRIALNC